MLAPGQLEAERRGASAYRPCAFVRMAARRTPGVSRSFGGSRSTRADRARACVCFVTFIVLELVLVRFVGVAMLRCPSPRTIARGLMVDVPPVSKHYQGGVTSIAS